MNDYLTKPIAGKAQATAFRLDRHQSRHAGTLPAGHLQALSNEHLASQLILGFARKAAMCRLAKPIWHEALLGDADHRPPRGTGIDRAAHEAEGNNDGAAGRGSSLARSALGLTVALPQLRDAGLQAETALKKEADIQLAVSQVDRGH